MKALSMLFAATAGERVVTRSPAGHMLHHRQAFSPDSRCLDFDSRNDGARLTESSAIGRVDLHTGEDEIIDRTPGPSPSGPGCGVITCCPTSGNLAFIHGLANAPPRQPYTSASIAISSRTPT